MGDRLFDHPFDPSRALAQLRGDGPALVAAARAAGLDARVPTCPDWSVAELLSHVGQVHGRVASLIAARQTAPPPPEPPRPPTGAALPDWLEEQFDALLTSLRSVQPYTPLWTWYPPEQDAAFWYRRMAHETLVHRADAELAAGRDEPSHLDQIIALDGIDEFCTRFLGFREIADRDPRPQSVAVVAAGRRWRVGFTGSTVQISRGVADPADAALAGTPSNVLYWLWGRVPDAAVDLRGDPATLIRLSHHRSLVAR